MAQPKFYYAVSHGRETGIFHTWNECKTHVQGFKNAVYKKFDSETEAQDFLDKNKNALGLAQPPVSRKIVANPNVRDQGPLLRRKRGFDYEDDVDTSARKKIDLIGTRVSVVYTDGASSNNGKGNARAGYGVYWGKNDPRNASVRLPGKRQTNQRAEASAVIHALESSMNETDTLEIMTDSQYVINAVTTWSKAWVEKGWKGTNGKEIQNRDLFEKILRLIKNRKGEVKLTYVPGHQGVPGNEEADRLAVAAVNKN
ncbi:Ribonuclease H1 [Choanephora cucurbitarum]|uniref:Ribonuclease H n=1 Tax=Choanephora cucurbitarum TaxID=101091 RepID=A0A1C7NRU9_9FUNG|nr:Ribonuclease H1 [Choanephora cucurbitarum]